MVRKQYVWAVATAFLLFTAGLAVAGSMESGQSGSDYDRARSVEAEAYAGSSDSWLSNEPVETGAVPEGHTMDSETGARDDSARDSEGGWGEPAIDAGGGGE